MGTVKNNRLMPVNSDKTGNRKDFYSKVQFKQSTAFGNLSAFLRRGEGWDIRQEQRKGVKWENEREKDGDGEILGEKIVKKEIIHFFFLTLPPSFAMTPIV